MNHPLRAMPDRYLSPKQRRRELVNIISTAAVQLPNTLALTPNTPAKKLSESGQNSLNVTAKRPLNVSAVNTTTEFREDSL